MKKIVFFIFLIPSVSFADRLGGLNANSNVALSTKAIENSLTPTTTTQAFSVSFASAAVAQISSMTVKVQASFPFLSASLPLRISATKTLTTGDTVLGTETSGQYVVSGAATNDSVIVTTDGFGEDKTINVEVNTTGSFWNNVTFGDGSPGTTWTIPNGDTPVVLGFQDGQFSASGDFFLPDLAYGFAGDAFAVFSSGILRATNTITLSSLTRNTPCALNESGQIISRAINLSNSDVTGTVQASNGGTAMQSFTATAVLFAKSSSVLENSSMTYLPGSRTLNLSSVTVRTSSITVYSTNLFISTPNVSFSGPDYVLIAATGAVAANTTVTITTTSISPNIIAFGIPICSEIETTNTIQVSVRIKSLAGLPGSFTVYNADAINAKDFVCYVPGKAKKQ